MVAKIISGGGLDVREKHLGGILQKPEIFGYGKRNQLSQNSHGKPVNIRTEMVPALHDSNLAQMANPRCLSCYKKGKIGKNLKSEVMLPPPVPKNQTKYFIHLTA